MFETWGHCRYPTTDGRWLEIGPESLAGTLSLRYQFRDPADMLPTDAIACDFQTTDDEGRIWTTTSRFTTEVFITHMFDFSLRKSMNLFWPRKAEKEYKNAFKTRLLLRKANFSSDDRFYRTLLIEDQLIRTKFKYTRITFDVAVVQTKHPYLTKLAIKVRAGSLLDEEEIEDVGEFGYYMSCLHLLQHNTGVFNEERGRWGDSPVPMPLVFDTKGKRGTLQANVRVAE